MIKIKVRRLHIIFSSSSSCSIPGKSAESDRSGCGGGEGGGRAVSFATGAGGRGGCSCEEVPADLPGEPLLLAACLLLTIHLDRRARLRAGPAGLSRQSVAHFLLPLQVTLSICRCLWARHWSRKGEEGANGRVRMKAFSMKQGKAGGWTNRCSRSWESLNVSCCLQ